MRRLLLLLLLPGLALGAPKKPKKPRGAPTPVDQPAPPDEGALPAPPDVAGPPADAIVTSSGLAWKLLKAGPDPAGERPVARSAVEVHYTGWTTDGKMFDSSIVRGQTAKFPLDKVILGWTEGLQLLRRGDVARLWIPESLAYQGQSGPPAGMLVFDVELIDFTNPIPAPIDVGAPPPIATCSASGLCSRVIHEGTGDTHPSAQASVMVHYTGWTSDGVMFDSSVIRGRPATLPLNGVIAGWTEGVQLMVVGEQRRLWLPAAMAYGSAPGRPNGMLVFDIELLGFEEP